MANLTPTELLDWLERNQFLTPIQADNVRPLLINIPDSMALVKELIRRDWLTPFQVNQIMKGQQDDLVLGPYRLRERIGEGAMGAVFKAWNLRLGRIVAVKTLNKAMIDSPKALDRFRREAQTASQLDHPNIALVRDADEFDGRLYLIMDFIEGANLSQRVKKEGPLPIGEAVEYARQAALGLQHAFERGIIHRDIKPSNLIVTTANHNGDARPLVKILDFGLARSEGDEQSGDRLTQLGHMIGTVDYVAPEQAQDARSADIRSDIYALGCTLFYLLTGKPPFLGDSMLERLGPRVTGEPPWVRTQRAEAPPALEAVLRTMMARKPEDRYQTPLEVAQALQPFARMDAVAPIAMAMPVTTPVAGVKMATPVMGTPLARPIPVMPLPTPEEAMAQTIPMAALPAAAMAPAPPLREAAFLGMSATGRDMAASTSPSRAQKPGKPFPVKLVVLLGGGFLVSALACAGLLYLFFAGKPAPKTGTLRITKAKWSMGDQKAIPGEPHRILVWIERVDFKGPVTLYLKDPHPPGLQCDARVIGPKVNEAELPFIVSVHTLPYTKAVTLVAENEEYHARAEWPLTLTVKEDPYKNKK